MKIETSDALQHKLPYQLVIIEAFDLRSDDLPNRYNINGPDFKTLGGFVSSKGLSQHEETTLQNTIMLTLIDRARAATEALESESPKGQYHLLKDMYGDSDLNPLTDLNQALDVIASGKTRADLGRRAARLVGSVAKLTASRPNALEYLGWKTGLDESGVKSELNQVYQRASSLTE